MIQSGLNGSPCGSSRPENSTSTWLVPTLAASLGVSEAIKSGVPMWLEAAEKERITAGAAEASVRAAIAAGVKIAMGTCIRMARTCANWNCSCKRA